MPHWCPLLHHKSLVSIMTSCILVSIMIACITGSHHDCIHNWFRHDSSITGFLHDSSITGSHQYITCHWFPIMTWFPGLGVVDGIAGRHAGNRLLGHTHTNLGPRRRTHEHDRWHEVCEIRCCGITHVLWWISHFAQRQIHVIRAVLSLHIYHFTYFRLFSIMKIKSNFHEILNSCKRHCTTNQNIRPLCTCKKKIHGLKERPIKNCMSVYCF